MNKTIYTYTGPAYLALIPKPLRRACHARPSVGPRPDAKSPSQKRTAYPWIPVCGWWAVWLCLGLAGCQPRPAEEKKRPDSAKQARYTNYVNPFIGTGGHGHTYPGAVVPFGMAQPSPDMGITGWDWCSGYHYSDSVIVGFSQTHLSGTGIGDLADVLLMPTLRKPNLATNTKDRGLFGYQSAFSHGQEAASPGFYQVYLPDNRVWVALTASPRCAMHRYQYDPGDTAYVVLDLGYAVNWDKATDTRLQVLDDSTLVGFRHSTGWAKDQRQFFAIRFSAPISAYDLYQGASAVPPRQTQGTASKALLYFAGLPDNTLMAKVGLSPASIAGATAALGEITHWRFAQTRQAAVDTWERHLSRIAVSGGDENLKNIFYTALYHTQIAPMRFADALGQYKAADSTIRESGRYTRYSVFSLWDTFRAAHPLYTLVNPDLVDDWVNSMLAHYDEHGLLPVWELAGNETNTMTGYHAVPVIVDAFMKGFNGFDAQRAYRAVKASGMQDIRGVGLLKAHGYIPADLENESVTKNLEYAFDDWCIAMMAQRLGFHDDYQYFMGRAGSYKQLYDPNTGFMRGKLADGSWRVPFDPKFSAHRVGADYTEGNAWQHSWFVPHDVPGLMALMGGPEAFAKKLDTLFSMDSEITGDNVSADITGMIGQYAHGNEPSHHIAYLYNYAGMPWKTQETVRKIMATLYQAQPDGLSGNEDCGQMSAWYVFSALGFYPMNPASGVYMLGSPLFEEATIRMPNGRRFVVKAPGVSDRRMYIGQATLNGAPYDKNYITHETIVRGGELVLCMAEMPNKTRGTQPGANPPGGMEEKNNKNDKK